MDPMDYLVPEPFDDANEDDDMLADDMVMILEQAYNGSEGLDHKHGITHALLARCAAELGYIRQILEDSQPGGQPWAS